MKVNLKSEGQKITFYQFVVTVVANQITLMIDAVVLWAIMLAFYPIPWWKAYLVLLGINLAYGAARIGHRDVIKAES